LTVRTWSMSPVWVSRVVLRSSSIALTGIARTASISMTTLSAFALAAWERVFRPGPFVDKRLHLILLGGFACVADAGENEPLPRDRL
jgi:hypothetical protein